MSLLPEFYTATDLHQRVAAAAKARRLAMNITQAALAQRAGVSLATLKRFENGGTASFATVLAVAESLDALAEFTRLFPAPEAATLDDLTAPQRGRKRARGPHD
ncbi:helix-turn-helix transcriptional regulator [Cognatishimia sp. SS12]|uniref:helix-turn-helix domain-containing protein n=1 Tax=Cognatishimia sp. SS12 TaxID=2979465 RepID=UPI00232EFA8D|nr:helix-turn-helix transcriptional regulator [Cognatishimia sp. SS12]MDC0739355.1 helix-turn-helix transcriptional regulator [Cognatishimia sp. SS12]